MTRDDASLEHRAVVPLQSGVDLGRGFAAQDPDVAREERLCEVCRFRCSAQRIKDLEKRDQRLAEESLRHDCAHGKNLQALLLPELQPIPPYQALIPHAPEHLHRLASRWRL